MNSKPKIAVIGRGLVAQQVIDIVKPDTVFTSSNILELSKTAWDTIYCAAPSGNRIWAKQHPILDKSNVWQIINECAITKFQRFVLFSTCDTQVNSDSAYGHNRLQLENWAKTLPNSSIIRLPSLIHTTITKNMLYDIKHNCWLDKINPNNQLQWFDLSLLKDWIMSGEREVNVCSEPVLAQDILAEFAPAVLEKLDYTRKGDVYDLKPYSYTREEIFASISEYFK